MPDQTTNPPTPATDPISALFGTLSTLIGLSASQSGTQARNQRYLGLAAIGLALLQNFGVLRTFSPAAPAPVAQSAPAPVNRASDIKPWDGPISPAEGPTVHPNPPKDKPAPPH